MPPAAQQMTRTLIQICTKSFRYSQLLPAIFTQGLSVIFILTFLTIAIQDSHPGKQVLQIIFQTLHLPDHITISSENPAFWKTMLAVYFIVSTIIGALDFLHSLRHPHTPSSQTWWQTVRWWLALPTLAFICSLSVGIIPATILIWVGGLLVCTYGVTINFILTR